MADQAEGCTAKGIKKFHVKCFEPHMYIVIEGFGTLEIHLLLLIQCVLVDVDDKKIKKDFSLACFGTELGPTFIAKSTNKRQACR